jgi:hypothetical protein
LEINDIKIKYYTSANRIKIDSNYTNKKLSIYIENGGEINVYLDGIRVQQQNISISELANTLNTIK